MYADVLLFNAKMQEFNVADTCDKPSEALSLVKIYIKYKSMCTVYESVEYELNLRGTCEGRQLYRSVNKVHKTSLPFA